MANLRVLVPQSTTNYVKNPSVKIDTTGYVAVGATITRSLDRARFGISSLKIVTNGAVLYEGTYYRVLGLSGIQSPVTVSVYVRGEGAVRIRLMEGSSQWASKAVFLNDTRWQRISVSGRCIGSDDVRLYVETDKNIRAVTFYADGFQMEPLAEVTTYADGDQLGCRWNSVAHSTISTRNANTRHGGRWTALAGPCRDEDDIYVTQMGGFGFPPIALNTQSYAELPGSYYQNIKVFSRPLTLAFHVKKKNLRAKGVPKLDALHGLRQQLIDIFKPDLAKNNQAFLFEYDEGDKPLYLSMRYEAGLEGDWDIRNRWINEFPIRFLAVSPFFLEDSQETTALDFQQDFLANYIVGRVDGKWDRLNYGVNGAVYGMASGLNGELYVGGSFTQVNYGAPAPYPTLNAKYIAYWDGTQFQQLGTGAAVGSSIQAIAVAPNGYVYVTGIFTSIGGVVANYVAYWNGTTWNAMGTGLGGGYGYDIKIAPNGDVYVGGDFTTAGGVAAYRVARWNGVSWNAIGAYNGLNSDCDSIAISPDGTTIYFGGLFTDQYSLAGAALNYVAKYVVDTDTFSAMSTGMNAEVRKVLISDDGTVFAGGYFTTAGGESALYIAQWNGNTWLALGDGMDNYVFTLALTKDGLLYAGGWFDNAGGVEARTIAVWNGYNWVHSDIAIGIAGSTTAKNIAISQNGDVFIGGNDFAGTNSKAAEITSVENVGSAEVSPVAYILGPCNLRWLENQTSGARMFFDMTVLTNEEVFIDFGAGTIRSTVRGDLLYTLLPGSDFKKFTLLPGVNKISSFMVNDTNAVMRIIYQPKHWSADSTSREAEL